MLVQLVYMSAATRAFASHELPALLSKTRMKNEILGVGGMLVYHQGSFLQVLEGLPSVVDKLYEKIALDDRHTNCELLLRTFLNQRGFAEWKMGFVNTNEFRNTKLLPGYCDFFDTAETFTGLVKKPEMAQKLLLAFRDGAWRQTVEDQKTEMLAMT